LPGGPPSGDGRIPPSEVYRTAVEEYRFQAQFNWSRTQYLLGFNVAILAAAIALASSDDVGVAAALVFVFGMVGAAASIVVVQTQHDYYRAARDHMRRVEQAYGVGEDERIDSTSTLGGRARRLSVNHVVLGLLTTLAIADAVGGFLVVVRALA